ncbi:MAG TPA: hypothetical protein VIN59_08600 [Alphaproteobacteria bacterium]
MMLRKTLLSAILLGAFAVPAMAEDVPANTGPGSGGAPGKMEFKNPADTNGDGILSKAEFMAAQEKRFAEIDKDGDGNITKEEHKAHRESKKAEWQAKRKEMKDHRGDGEGPGEPPVD